VQHYIIQHPDSTEEQGKTYAQQQKPANSFSPLLFRQLFINNCTPKVPVKRTIANITNKIISSFIASLPAILHMYYPHLRSQIYRKWCIDGLYLW
jgi:hypothetical protein